MVNIEGPKPPSRPVFKGCLHKLHVIIQCDGAR